MRKILFFFVFALALFAQKQSIAIDVNNEDLEGSYELFSPIGEDANLYYGFTVLRGADEYDKMRVSGSFHIKAIGLTPLDGLAVGIGLKVAMAYTDDNEEDEYTFAAPLHVGAIYTLPIAVKTHIAALFDFAPTALCFNDCDRYTQLRFEAGIEPIEGGMIFGGWRKIELREEGWKYELNKAAYIGVRISF
ncbi:MAG: hypothetical protein LBQ52_04125 [Helicobacteraceae bacterium]|jgi:hypothetical protein|nr:hypothetical protein [Helicobacteraceae bacterium]